jgi:hypothetical protein
MVQLGVDRIVDFTFGSNEAAYHLILELYDRVRLRSNEFLGALLFASTLLGRVLDQTTHARLFIPSTLFPG